MSDDAAIREQLNRIERCLIGDHPMGQLGLVARVNNHAARLKRLEVYVYRIAASVVGGSVIIAAGYKLVVDWWPRR